MKEIWNHLKDLFDSNIQGFTMVGAIMAFGMLGGLTLVLAKMSTHQMSIQKRSESYFAINTLVEQIERTIYNHTACVKTVKENATGNLVRFTTGSTIGLKFIKNKNGQKIFRKNGIYGDGLIKVVNLSLKDILVTGTSAEANLYVTFEKMAHTIISYNKVLKTFPLSIELNALGQAIGCYSELDASITIAKKQVCNGLGTYDSISGTCSFSRNLKCSDGQIATSFDGDGSPLCNTLSSGDPHPVGSNCYLIGNYRGSHAMLGHFQPLKESALVGDATKLDRWAYCYDDGTVTGAVHCPSTPINDVNITLRTCPPGYTNRFIHPINPAVYVPETTTYELVSTRFLMEHYCCK